MILYCSLLQRNNDNFKQVNYAHVQLNLCLFGCSLQWSAVRSLDGGWRVQLTMSGPPRGYRGPPGSPSPIPFLRSPGGYRPYTPSPPPIASTNRRSMGSPCPLPPYIPCPTPRWPSPLPPGVPLPPGPRPYRMQLPVSRPTIYYSIIKQPHILLLLVF